MEEIIYFEINNWFAGRDYPNEEPFKQWVKDEQFSDDAWCKENGDMLICLKVGALLHLAHGLKNIARICSATRNSLTT